MNLVAGLNYLGGLPKLKRVAVISTDRYEEQISELIVRYVFDKVFSELGYLPTEVVTDRPTHPSCVPMFVRCWAATQEPAVRVEAITDPTLRPDDSDWLIPGADALFYFCGQKTQVLGSVDNVVRVALAHALPVLQVSVTPAPTPPGELFEAIWMLPRWMGRPMTPGVREQS